MITEKIIEESKKISDYVAMVRRTLHQNPEVGFDTIKTSKYIKEELINMNIEPHDCGTNGIVAIINGKTKDKVFLLRADIDALPLQEESDVAFISTNGNMHACGHDMHAAMLLGAAKLLKTFEKELNGTVKLMFQPGEEILQGAHNMINDGVLVAPKVDAGLMLHVMTGLPLSTGTVIVSSPGISAPSADFFNITVKGSGCHGSMPNTGVDPITIASHIVTNLQEINARELGFEEKSIITIGSINGGTTANVIPNTVLMNGTIRCYDEELRKYIKDRISQISENTAKTFRGKAKVEFTSECPTLLNDLELSQCCEKYLKELLGENNIFSSNQLKEQSSKKKVQKVSGSEDFAYVSHEIPAIMLALVAGQYEEGYVYPLHHPKVKFDEKALSIGSSIYAYMAIRWLEEHK